MSHRFFAISTIIFASFILFSAVSFAQETVTRTAQVGQVRENVAERVAEIRVDAQQSMATKRAEVAEKVKALTDENKKAALERITEAISNINENKTSRWAAVLDLLSGIIERIKTSLATLETEGTDVTSAVALVTAAESAIADASDAVELQAGKTYILEIEGETNLGQVVRPVMQQFKQDLRTTLTSILNARDAVRQAARGLAAVNSNNSEEPTQNNVITP